MPMHQDPLLVCVLDESQLPANVISTRIGTYEKLMHKLLTVTVSLAKKKTYIWTHHCVCIWLVDGHMTCRQAMLTVHVCDARHYSIHMTTLWHGNDFCIIDHCEGFPHSASILPSFDVSFDVSHNKLLHKQSRGRWIETSWRSLIIIIMKNITWQNSNSGYSMQCLSMDPDPGQLFHW